VIFILPFFHKRILNTALFSLLGFFTAAGPGWAEEVLPAGASIEMSKQAIHDRVKSMREERFKQMPYLDTDIIQDAVNTERAERRKAFMEGGEKSLRDLVNQARAVHTESQAALARVSLSRRRILLAVREMFPEVDFELKERDGSLQGGPFNSMAYAFTFRQPIFKGGSLWNTLLKEKAELNAADKEYESVLLELYKDVALAYFEYHRAARTEEDQGRIIKEMKQIVDISKQKYAQQITSEIENLNVESLYGQMQYDYETAKQELELAKLELEKFLDIKIGEDFRVLPLYSFEGLLSSAEAAVDTELKFGEDNPYKFSGSITIPKLQDMVDQAYQHRPDLQAETSKLESARLQEKIRWAEFMPQAEMVMKFGKLAEAFNDVNPDPGYRKEWRLTLELEWNVGGSTVGYSLDNQEIPPNVSSFQQQSTTQTKTNTLTASLLDSMDDFASTKEAEVERLDQLVELEKKEKEVVRDVKKAYFDYQKARIQVKSSLQRANYRQRVVMLTKHKLDNNEVETSEYLGANNDLLREINTLHKALADYFTAKAELNYAVGSYDFLPAEQLEDFYE